MTRVYFISGLGADRRSFSQLDLSWCEPVFLDWIRPVANESLGSYAARLGQRITEDDAVVIGLSLGGMLATELAKTHPGYRVILVSSNKLFTEFPGKLRLFRHLPVYKILPGFVFRNFQAAYTRLFGVTGQENKAIVYQIIRDSDPHFVRWGIHAILHWDNRDMPSNIRHIHGTADKLLPFAALAAMDCCDDPEYRAPVAVQGGGHLMILDKADEVSGILKRIALGWHQGV